MAASEEHIRSFSERAADEEPPEKATTRFLMELEFVQCLANPKYLHYLAVQGYFEDKAFLNYVEYLRYFKEPSYAVHLTFPQCLFFLEKLRNSEFREKLRSPDFVLFLHENQWKHWRTANQTSQDEVAP